MASDFGSKLLEEVMIFFALLLAVGLPLVGTQWTFNVRCFSCVTTNTFRCPTIISCPYEIRRCLILSVRVDSRTLMVFKNCTNNCTFVYPQHEPPPTPKASPRPNSYYFVHCCQGVECNGGGPSNIERDLLPDYTIEEELGKGIVHLGNAKCVLIFASMVVSNALT
nr:glycosyl-phosphatidylinositol-anchored molecule-like protein [Dasypus novemcinctus]